jgi:hypothetical protein
MQIWRACHGPPHPFFAHWDVLDRQSRRLLRKRIPSPAGSTVPHKWPSTVVFVCSTFAPTEPPLFPLWQLSRGLSKQTRADTTPLAGMPVQIPFMLPASSLIIHPSSFPQPSQRNKGRSSGMSRSLLVNMPLSKLLCRIFSLRQSQQRR